MKLIKDSAVLIISPSGNLYGSENVLLDYLNGTGWRHTVAVPVGTKLEQKLRGAPPCGHLQPPVNFLRSSFHQIGVWQIGVWFQKNDTFIFSFVSYE